MKDRADPLEGWSLPKVLQSHKGPAREDTYGALYEYVLARFCEFHDQLAVRKPSFELHCVDARLLKGFLGGRKFDRIEVCHMWQHRSFLVPFQYYFFVDSNPPEKIS